MDKFVIHEITYRGPYESIEVSRLGGFMKGTTRRFVDGDLLRVGGKDFGIKMKYSYATNEAINSFKTDPCFSVDSRSFDVDDVLPFVET